MRIAAIDIGSNSIRCTVVEAMVGGSTTTLDDEKEYTRLGRGMGITGRLSDEAVQATLEALDRMLRIAARYDVTHIRAIATAAVRDAQNGQEFVDRAAAELGLRVEVVSEQEEGRLAFVSAAGSFDMTGYSAVVDIGGGSVELVRATPQGIEFISSLPVGAVAMTERFHRTDPLSERDREQMIKHVRSQLLRVPAGHGEPLGMLIGSGGTISAAAALIAADKDPGIVSLHGYVIRRSEVARLLDALAPMTIDQRRSVKGMPEKRVDIIVAGLLVLLEAMKALGAKELVLNLRGLREGIVIDTVEREHGISLPFDPMASVREFGRRCRTDSVHAEKVRNLSLALFDALAQQLELPQEGRPLLEAAALLHDAGHHIAYERHHLHSYHLISYAEMPGFDARHRRLIAAMARYHRGPLPKARHEAMNDLGRADRQLVAQMASLLKLADGLDRSRRGAVRGLRAEARGEGIAVILEGDSPLDVELHDAKRKADLFESTFRLHLDVLAPL